MISSRMNSKLFIFDTNVFVSAALLTGSINARALDKAFKTGKVAVSALTFAEVTEVLFRKKFEPGRK
jgi:hypothetical protein